MLYSSTLCSLDDDILRPISHLLIIYCPRYLDISGLHRFAHTQFIYDDTCCHKANTGLWEYLCCPFLTAARSRWVLDALFVHFGLCCHSQWLGVPIFSLDWTNTEVVKDKLGGNYYAMVRLSIISLCFPSVTANSRAAASLITSIAALESKVIMSMARSEPKGRLLLQRFFPQICCDLLR